MAKKIFILLFILYIKPTFGYYTSTIPNACNTNYTMGAVFTRSMYTCSSGYFLPANTPGCVACPSGYSCAGGNFYFNETRSQGLAKNANLRTQNESKTCAANFPHVLKAHFVPNVINITWEDATPESVAANNAGSCTYGGTINTPAVAPTKRGHVFTGWTFDLGN